MLSKKLLSAFAIAVSGFCASTAFAQDATFSANGTFTVPAGVTTLKVEVWGGGGGGGATFGNSSAAVYRTGGGGGGGAKVTKTFIVVPGDTYSIVVGQGGTGGAGTSLYSMFGNPGGASTFTGNGASITSSGGTGAIGGGQANSGKGKGGILGGVYHVAQNTVSTTLPVVASPATGATATMGIASTNYYLITQGSGYTAVPTVTGSAGSDYTAFINANINSGGDSTSNYNGLSPSVQLLNNSSGVGGAGGGKEGAKGGAGGASVSGASASTAGMPGTAPGGGGSGAASFTTGGGRVGGDGAIGGVKIYYNAPIVPLPVSLISFNASASNNQAKLSWSTASEANNNRFEIQRSSDNKTYVTVATVTGNGTTSQKSSYTAYDANPANGVNYYKLVQIDNNGTTTELAIKSVNFSIAQASAVSVYPNPASGVLNVNVNSKTAQSAKALLIGSNGSVYIAQDLTLNAGANTAVINLSGKVAPGQYVLTVAGNDLQESVKVIVK